jgi:hypothetical protein
MFTHPSTQAAWLLSIAIWLVCLCAWPTEAQWTRFNRTTEGKILRALSILGLFVTLGQQWMPSMAWLGLIIMHGACITAMCGAKDDAKRNSR